MTAILGGLFGEEEALWIRKGQARLFALHVGIVGEAWLVERVLGLRPCALTEVMVLLQDRLASAET